MINKVLLLGRLGKDPIIRRLDNGRVVANLTLATNESYNRDGQRMESTEWHNLEMWDNQANTAEKYMKKGDLL
ncbi:MAG: single-stranded DNA-binding protein [Bacteroidia bacterium]